MIQKIIIVPMKNPIPVCAFILSGLFVNAQPNDFQTRSEVLESEKQMSLDRKKIKDQGVSSARVYSYEQGNMGYLSSEHIYDLEGNTIEFKYFKKNGKTKYHYTYGWDHNGKSIEFTNWKSNGKMKNRSTSDYDSSGNLTDTRVFLKSPERMVWHSVSRYDEKQNLVELKYLTDNDATIAWRYVYTYYEDGSKKQTIEYNRKNKVEHTWNFDCNPVGKSETKSLKDTSHICIRYETDKDGNKIKVKEENTKGTRFTRIISKYDQHNNLLDRAWYDSNERMKYHNRYLYDADNNMTEYIAYRGSTNEIKVRYINKYDSSGNLIEEHVFKKSSAPDRILKFVYAKR